MFENKTVLITGCGSLGRELIKQLLEQKALVKCLGHSEQPFFKLELELGEKPPELTFILGDITSYDAVESAVGGVDYVIHTVAKKFVNYIEDNPLLAINTNVFGTMNVIRASIRSDSVKKMLNISTDKVCNAISTYGLTKALTERLVMWANTVSNKKVFATIRHPNFKPSDGSCFDIWKQQATKGKPITITDKRMQRWFIPIEEAVRLTLKALELAKGGEIFIPAIAREMKMVDLAREYGENIKFIGKRPGERLRENLMTSEERKKAVLEGDFWRI